MSRRNHGGRPHRPTGHGRRAPAASAAPPTPGPAPRPDGAPVVRPADPVAPPRGPEPSRAAAASAEPRPSDAPRAAADAPLPPPGDRPAGPDAARPAPAPAQPRPNGSAADGSGGCTAPQLRRFIKSRPYVPMHELRRRFGINGADDDVCAVELSDGRVWVGLPPREGGLVGELLRTGDIGYELSLDPRTPIVVGLYPMRPVPRT